MKLKAIFDYYTLFAVSSGDPSTLRLLNLLLEANFQVVACYSQIVSVGYLRKSGDPEVAKLADNLIKKIRTCYGIEIAPARAANRAGTSSRLIFSSEAAANAKPRSSGPLDEIAAEALLVLHSLSILEEAKDEEADVLVTYDERLRRASCNHPGLPFKHGSFRDPWCCGVEELHSALLLRATVQS